MSTWLRRGLPAACLLVCLLLAAWPIFFHALRLDDYGRMQRDDYYGLLFRLTDGRDFEDTVQSFWNARINQHRVTLPALIWRSNVALTGGDNRVTAYLALGFLSAIFGLCLWQLRRPGRRRGHQGRRARQGLKSLATFAPSLRDEEMPDSPSLSASRDDSATENVAATTEAASLTASPEIWLAVPILAWALLGPQMTYNLGKSFGGVHYYLSDLLCLGAMAALLRIEDTWRRRACVFALGLVGILTFSSALAVWPALLLGCFWLRRPPGDIVTVLLGGVASSLIFRAGLGGEAIWPSPAALADYVAVFLGALLRQDVAAARLLGAVGLGLLAVFGVVLWRRRERLGLFWFMAAAYCATNGVLAGLGRSGEGVEQAMAIRYVLFPGLFWAAILVLALRLLPSQGLAALAKTVAVAALAVLGLRPAALEGRQHSDVFLQAGRWQMVVETQMRHHAWDAPLVGFAVTHFPPAVLSPKRIALWTSLGHIPFDQPAETPPDRGLDPTRLGEPLEEGAFTEIVETTDPHIVRVGGWIPIDADIEEVVFTDVRGRQRSLLHLWPHPKFDDRLQWAGLVLWAPEWKTWTPFAIEQDGTLRPLSPARHVASRWQELEAARRASQRSPGPRATPRNPPRSPSTDDPAGAAAPPG